MEFPGLVGLTHNLGGLKSNAGDVDLDTAMNAWRHKRQKLVTSVQGRSTQDVPVKSVAKSAEAEHKEDSTVYWRPDVVLNDAELENCSQLAFIRSSLTRVAPEVEAGRQHVSISSLHQVPRLWF